MTARDLFFGKRKYFYQIPGNRFVYKISVVRVVCQLVNNIYFSDFYSKHEHTAVQRNEGWFEFTMKQVSQLQQILFILFTIMGFILCILSIALRADMWFKDEWSSFILGTFVPYIISTCLSALIFVKESGKGGIR